MKTAATLLMLATAVPVAEIRHFRFARPVAASGSNGQVCVAIDPGLFAHAAPQLSDLRLYTARKEVPYAVRMAMPAFVPERSIAVFNAGRKGNSTVFDAVMPAGSYSDVTLAIDAKDFIASVTVSGSQQEETRDGTTLGTFTIFDLTKQRLGRSTVLHLPQSDFRYLHFRIDGPIGPENVSGISVEPSQTGEQKYQLVAQSANFIQSGHESVIEFDVPDHTPVDRVVFVPGGQPANFSREVAISIKPGSASAPSESADTGTDISGGSLERIHRVENGLRVDEERLAVPVRSWLPAGPTHWEIKVENGDDAPVAWQTVRLEMIERELCFDAAAGAAYTLYYGDPALPAPQYDYARLFTSSRDAATGRLGPETPNAQYEPRADARPFTERHPALLWIALGTVVVVLGGIAFRSARATVQAE